MAETPGPEDRTKNFILYSERVGEGNWEWFRAEGFRPYETLPQEELEYPQYAQYTDQFGGENVREGDVFDLTSDRPLRHIPGMTVYVRHESDDASRHLGDSGNQTQKPSS